jgi:hypothetical protein
MTVDPAFVLTAQYFLALLFFVNGLHKAANLPELRATITAYRIVPSGIAHWIAGFVMTAELLLGVALTSGLSRLASLVAAGVLALYFAVMALSLARGLGEVDCGCGLHGRASPLSVTYLVRNGLLILLALLASMPASGRVVGSFDAFQIVAATLSLALLYISADSLLANRTTTAALES